MQISSTMFIILIILGSAIVGYVFYKYDDSEIDDL